MNVHPVVVIGSGPAGIAAARALLDSGVDVLLVEAGDVVPPVPRERPSLSAARQGIPAAARFLLGDDLSALLLSDGQSPKLRTSAVRASSTAYGADHRIETGNFRLIGTTAPGGLSRIWGAVTGTFDAEDMRAWPITPDDLKDSYHSVAARIGMSGSDDDAMAATHGRGLPLQPALPLSTMAATMLNRFHAAGSSDGFILGRGRSAVLSADLGERRGCNLCMGCVWGCPRGSIYDGAIELASLLGHPRLSMLEGHRVDAVERDKQGQYRLIATTREGPRIILARTIVLAAGTFVTTRLALRLLEKWDEPRPVLSNPAAAFALWMPRRLGASLDSKGFGLVQLMFRLPIDPDGYAIGQLYEAQAFAAPDLAWAMPLSRPGALRVLRGLLPGLLVGLLYFPGTFSRNSVRLVRHPDGSDGLVVEGGTAPEYPMLLRRTGHRLRRAFRRLHTMLLPGSLQPYMPGAEVHYAGTLPMGRETTESGELVGAPNVFVVDGAVLPSLPAKHLTFTIMANADRIARQLGKRLAS